ncbi:hypothetical protein [Streptomyces griseorubiginosus]|uniref:hypothetical protein n=1 Tax=Streptomyces griseorubiginosus TaxID=67304 RepID=UPI00364D0174
MTAGHWLDGTGQVVVPRRFLETTGTEIGDTVRVTVGKETAALRIVGVAFGSAEDQLEIQVNAADFPATKPQVFLVDVKAGVQPTAYAEKLSARIRSLGAEATANSPSRQHNMVLVLNTMAALLTLMLVSVAVSACSTRSSSTPGNAFTTWASARPSAGRPGRP